MVELDGAEMPTAGDAVDKWRLQLSSLVREAGDKLGERENTIPVPVERMQQQRDELLGRFEVEQIGGGYEIGEIERSRLAPVELLENFADAGLTSRLHDLTLQRTLQVPDLRSTGSTAQRIKDDTLSEWRTMSKRCDTRPG